MDCYRGRRERRPSPWSDTRPEPILVSIASALATKGATSLYELVRNKFAGRKQALAALEAAKDAEEGSPLIDALATELHEAERADPAFAGALRAQWNSTRLDQHATGDAVVNNVTGTVGGNLVQARDIQGGISFGS